MSTTTYSEPVGSVLHFPDGHTVKLTGGQHVNVPAGTIVEGGVGGGGPRTLPVAGVVIAEGSPGQTEPTVTGTRPPPKGLAPHGHPNTKAWNETPEGSKLEGGYAAFKGTFQTHIPAISQQLKLLAHRPIGG